MGADVKSPRQSVDENLHAVLGAHRTGDGRDHGKQDRGMRQRSPPHIASEKRKWAITVATSLFHFGRNSPVGCARATRFMQRENRLRSSAGTHSTQELTPPTGCRELTARPLKLTRLQLVSRN